MRVCCLFRDGYKNPRSPLSAILAPQFSLTRFQSMEMPLEPTKKRVKFASRESSTVVQLPIWLEFPGAFSMISSGCYELLSKSV